MAEPLGPTKQISVRLALEFHEVLERRAKLEDTSPGLLAKRLLIELLTADENSVDPIDDTRARVADLQNDIATLREDLWSSVVALLTNAGQVDTAAATAWVEKNLMKADPPEDL